METTCIFRPSKLHRKEYVETMWIFRPSKLHWKSTPKWRGNSSKFGLRRTDVIPTSNRRGFDVVCPLGYCHYWYFLSYSFEFQPNVCHRCHDFFFFFINISDISILNIKGSDYCCVINLISKNGAIKFIQNGDLTKKAEHHETYTKMCKEILTFGNIEIEKR